MYILEYVSEWENGEKVLNRLECEIYSDVITAKAQAQVKPWNAPDIGRVNHSFRVEEVSGEDEQPEMDEKRLKRYVQRCQDKIDKRERELGDDYSSDGMKDEIWDYLAETIPPHEQGQVIAELEF